MSIGNLQPKIETGNTLEAKVNKLRDLVQLNGPKSSFSIGVEEAIKIIENGKNLPLTEILEQLKREMFQLRSDSKYDISKGVDDAIRILRE
jgi:hypothetical protein